MLFRSIKFKVKDTTKTSTTICLRNIVASNGKNDLPSQNAIITVNIKQKEEEVKPPIEEPKPDEKPTPIDPPKQDEDTNKPGGDINQGGNTNPGDNTPTDTKPSVNPGTNAGTNNGSNNNPNKNPNTGTNSNKKPVTNNIEQNEIVGINDENTIDNNTILNENENNVNNVIPMVGKNEEKNEDKDFNYPLLIGGTMAIIVAEIVLFIRKKNIKTNKAVRNSSNIVDSEYNDYDEIAKNDAETAVQDNVSEVLEQNSVTGNKWENKIGRAHV